MNSLITIDHIEQHLRYSKIVSGGRHEKQILFGLARDIDLWGLASFHKNIFQEMHDGMTAILTPKDNEDVI